MWYGLRFTQILELFAHPVFWVIANRWFESSQVRQERYLKILVNYMIALKVREEDASRVRWELGRFKVPFQEREGSTLFVIPVVHINMLMKLKSKDPLKNWRVFDETDLYYLLSYITQIGIRAKLIFPV